MENELVNLILTIVGLIIGWLVILWLDRNVFNKNRYYNKRRKK